MSKEQNSTTDIFVNKPIDDFISQVKKTMGSAELKAQSRGKNMAAKFTETIASLNSDRFYRILGFVLNKQYFSIQDFHYFVLHFGGELKLIREIRQFRRYRYDRDAYRSEALTRIKGSFSRQIRRRLNHDNPLPDDVVDVYQLERDLRDSKQAMRGAQFLARIVTGLIILQPTKEWLDKHLAILKKYVSRLAGNLADNDFVYTATLIETINDLLVPGSTFDLSMNMLPVGKGAGLVALSYKKASAVVFRQLIKKGVKQAEAKALKKHLDEVTEQLLKKMDPEVQQLVRKGSAGDREAILKLTFLQKLVDEIVPIYRSAQTKQGKKVLNNASKKIMPNLKNYLQTPLNSKATSKIIELDSGEVIQVIHSKFVRRTGDRVADAQKTAEKLGLFSEPGEHWSHLVPDVQQGDDALYNLIRASERINVSYMKQIDNLVVPKGATVQIEIKFDNAINAFNRHADEITYKILQNGKTINQKIFKKPLQTPILTASQLRKLANDLLPDLSKSPESEWKLRGVQFIVDFLVNMGEQP